MVTVIVTRLTPTNRLEKRIFNMVFPF